MVAVHTTRKIKLDIKITIALILISLALFFDLKSRIIPDWIVLTGLAVALWFGNPLQAILGGAFGFLFGCAIDTILYVLLKRNIGGGDIKAMTMIGALTGPLAFIILPVSLAIGLIHGFIAHKIIKAESIPCMPALFIGFIIGVKSNAL